MPRCCRWPGSAPKKAHWQSDVNGGQWDLVGAQRLEGLQPVTPHIDPDYRQPYKSASDYAGRDFALSIQGLRQPAADRAYQYAVAAAQRVWNQSVAACETHALYAMADEYHHVVAGDSFGVEVRALGQLKAAAMKCLIYSGLCMATTFVSTMLASQPQIAGPGWQWQWPALMAWVPILIFGPCAVYLLDKIETYRRFTQINADRTKIAFVLRPVFICVNPRSSAVHAFSFARRELNCKSWMSGERNRLGCPRGAAWLGLTGMRRSIGGRWVWRLPEAWVALVILATLPFPFSGDAGCSSQPAFFCSRPANGFGPRTGRLSGFGERAVACDRFSSDSPLEFADSLAQ